MVSGGLFVGFCLSLSIQTCDKLITNIQQTYNKPNQTVNKLINYISAIFDNY